MPTPDGEDVATLVARHSGTRALDLEVVATQTRTPAVRRLRLGGEGLADLDVEPGQDLMVEVPADGFAHFRRRYTIRHLDRASSAVDLDVILHGDGPGARWARAARSGDRVEAVGPRGKIRLADGAAWHAFFGDESAIPAVFSMVEALEADATAVALLQVSGPEEEQQPEDARCGLSLHWVHRQGAPGTGDQLASAAAQLELPPGRGHCYVFGERRQVKATRDTLIGRGIDPAAIDHKSYWYLGRSNAAHGEPPRPESD